jgi:hypothetical protein
MAQDTQTGRVQSTKVQVYVSASGVRVTGRTPSLHAHAKVARVCMSSRYSCCTVRTACRISTAVIRTEERCFSVNPKGDEKFESSILRSAGKGRVEV